MNDENRSMQDIIGLHLELHRELRKEIEGLSSEELNWTPGPGTSSIGTIVTHVLGGQAEMLRNVLEMPTARNREAEFAAQNHEADQLLRLLDVTDDDWQQLAPRLRDGDLQALRTRPNKPVPQSSLFWLVRNYGHLREHLAQVQLTRQLYESTRT
ncbi:MAG TPA: DinB family protein [Chloroflexia bacterium]|jgi:hypothetical protein